MNARIARLLAGKYAPAERFPLPQRRAMIPDSPPAAAKSEPVGSLHERLLALWARRHRFALGSLMLRTRASPTVRLETRSFLEE